MLNDLYQKQAELDTFIIKTKGLEGENLLPFKMIALISEVGEMLNEWRGFKYWSEDREPRTSTITGADAFHIERANPLLEEYIDGLHFLLSIGNDLNKTFEYKQPPEVSIETLIIGITNMITQLATHKPIYPTLMNHYWYLGEKLGFTETEIRGAYENKYRINIERQKESY